MAAHFHYTVIFFHEAFFEILIEYFKYLIRIKLFLKYQMMLQQKHCVIVNEKRRLNPPRDADHVFLRWHGFVCAHFLCVHKKYLIKCYIIHNKNEMKK